MYNNLSNTIHYNHNTWLIQQHVYVQVPLATAPPPAHIIHNHIIEPPNKLKHKEVVLYKTESCRNWTELGHCRYGKKCRYAHGVNELRNVPRHTRYKTQICRAYHMDGSCPYGIRCTFVHDSDSPQEKMTGSSDNSRLIQLVNHKRRNSFMSHDDEASMSGSSSGDESCSAASTNDFQYSYYHRQNAKEFFMKQQQQPIETMHYYNNAFKNNNNNNNNNRTTMWM